MWIKRSHEKFLVWRKLTKCSQNLWAFLIYIIYIWIFAIKKGMWAVKLCSNKILQFLHGSAGQHGFTCILLLPPLPFNSCFPSWSWISQFPLDWLCCGLRPTRHKTGHSETFFPVNLLAQYWTTKKHNKAKTQP